jgi:predicted MFS family arabinose efflux permease
LLKSSFSGLRIAFAGLLALAVAMGIGRFAFTPVLPMMLEDTGLSVAGGGWLASANYFGYLVGALSAMVIKVRPAAAICLGLPVIGLATLAMGFTGGFMAWAMLRTLAGIASAWVLIAVSVRCLELLAPLRRPMLNGVVFAGVGTGITVAGLLCIALMHYGAGSAWAWISSGMFALLASVIAAPVLGRGGGARTADSDSAPADARRWNREFTRLVLCYGATGFGYIIPATFLPVMAKQAIADPALFGWSWPVFGAAALASTLAAAARPAALGNRSLWIVSHFIMALGVVLPVAVPGLAGILLSALLVGSTFVVITMAGMQEARQVAGAHAQRLMAAMTAAFALAQVAGPLFASVLLGADGSFSTALLFAGALLAASGAALARRASATPPGELTN